MLRHSLGQTGYLGSLWQKDFRALLEMKIIKCLFVVPPNFVFCFAFIACVSCIEGYKGGASHTPSILPFSHIQLFS